MFSAGGPLAQTMAQYPPRPQQLEMARRIAADFNKAMAEPKTRTRIDGVGFTVLGNTPEEFAAQLRRESDLVARIVKTAGIQPLE